MTKQRHMAVDKLNTRGDSGPVEPITGQPVEGRRRCGGQRFGSMEIDAMVAHGAAAALYSRIPRSSDYLPNTPVCQRCRAFAYEDARTKKLHCTTCGHGHHVYYVATHRAFKVLSAETISTGVRPGLIITPLCSPPSPPSPPRLAAAAAGNSHFSGAGAVTASRTHRRPGGAESAGDPQRRVRRRTSPSPNRLSRSSASLNATVSKTVRPDDPSADATKRPEPPARVATSAVRKRKTIAAAASGALAAPLPRASKQVRT
jgi:hypothetical protein